MAFKMKYSPAKGKLDGFFSSLGKQLKRNRKDIGGEFKGVKQKDKPRTDVLTKNIKNTSQPGDEAVRPKKATVSNKPKVNKAKKKVSSKGNFFNFSGKKGDKFKYRIGPSKTDGSHRQFQRPGSDVWESSKTKKGSRAIGDLYIDDYEGQNVEITPIQKRKTKIKKKK